MSLYQGDRRPDGNRVMANGAPLKPRPDLLGGAFQGYDWGRDCLGARHVAIAILADRCGDDAARQHHLAFLEMVVQHFSDHWSLSGAQVDAILSYIKALEAQKQR
ncbi:MAG: DUF6166 domain-containing protein [Pseudomonadota bacterium]